MAKDTQAKAEIVKKFRQSELDTGSSHVQVALLTHRINHLTEHFKTNKNDVHGQRGLVKLVNRRRKLLDYLRYNRPSEYTTLITDLGLRK